MRGDGSLGRPGSRADSGPALIDIRGMGNRLRHAYNSIDFDVIWKVVADRLPHLKADAAPALEK